MFEAPKKWGKKGIMIGGAATMFIGGTAIGAGTNSALGGELNIAGWEIAASVGDERAHRDAIGTRGADAAVMIGAGDSGLNLTIDPNAKAADFSMGMFVEHRSGQMTVPKPEIKTNALARSGVIFPGRR